MINKPKGTYDVFGSDAILYNKISNIINASMINANVNFIRTPIFESSELFHRSVGETSDIVSKETYDFTDRADRKLTLRPENTASVVRAVIENKLLANQSGVCKYYYLGTMYRYERPQSGRNREFTQFGIEAFNTKSVILDAEIIKLGYNLINEFGIKDITVHLNTLGDAESKENYKNALKEYIKPYLKDLCPDCNKRYETNPLRILDCKFDQDSEILKNVPKISDYLSDESKKRFDEVKKLLLELDVDFVVDEKIVRGLDYYTDVVYEIKSEDGLVLGAGGRYDNLVSTLGGDSIPATGFAIGIERVILKLKEKEDVVSNSLDAFILAVSTEEKYHALKIMDELRSNCYSVDMCANDVSLKSQFKMADRLNSGFLIILNDEDLKKGLVTIKDNNIKEEVKVDISEISDYFYDNL